MATMQVMSAADQAQIRSSKAAARVLSHNGELMGKSRPVLLDEIIGKAIEAGWIEAAPVEHEDS